MSPAIATDAAVTKAKASDSAATFHVVTHYDEVLYDQWTYDFDGQAAVVPTLRESLVTNAKAKEVLL